MSDSQAIWKSILLSLNASRAREADDALADALTRHLETVRSMTETEVSKRPRTRHLWLFRKPYDIRSIGELNQCSREFLQRGDWDTLNAIAETGEWLLSDWALQAIHNCLEQRSQKPVHIKAIVREEQVPLALGANHVDTIGRVIDREFGGVVTIAFTPLPWWMHNRHLTLLTEGGKEKRGIYFPAAPQNTTH